MQARRYAGALRLVVVPFLFPAGCSSSEPRVVVTRDAGTVDGALDANGLPSDSGGHPTDGAATEAGEGGAPVEAGPLPPPLNDDQRSGTRLKGKWLVTTAGAAQFEMWHDTQLGIDCAFAVASDGQTRCLPTGASLGQNAGTYFSDAACTVPVFSQAHAQACTAVAPFLGVTDVTVCPARTHVQPIGSILTNQPSIYFSAGPGQCDAMSAAPYYDVYAIGPETDASTFAQGEPTQSAAVGGIAVATITTSDGASQTLGPVDTASGLPCTPGTASDQTTRCLPETPAFVGLASFQDSACTQAAITSETGACPAPSLAGMTVDAHCQGSESYVQVGAALSSYWSVGYNSTGKVCIPETSAPGSAINVYGVGTAIAATAFVAAPSASVPALGNLGQVAYVLPGNVVDRTSWHDVSLDVDCSFGIAADGMSRCLPGGALSIDVYFSDAGCTHAVATSGDVSCIPVPQYAYQVNVGVCPAQEHIFSVTGPYTGSLYIGIPSACSLMTPGSVAAYSVGPEVAATTFTPATEQLR